MNERKSLGLTVLLGALAAMAPLATDMYLPALPGMITAFKANASTIQLTLTMTMLGMATGQLLAGPVSDMLGRRRPLIAGMTAFCLSSLGCAMAEDIEVFLGCRFLQGFAGAFGIVGARAVARDLCEGAELMRFFAMLMLVNGVAPVAAPVIGGQILYFASWRGVFYLLTAIGAALAISCVFFGETLPAEKRKEDLLGSFKSFGKLVKDRYFLGHCLIQWFFFAAFFAYIAGSSFLLQNIYQVSPQEFSLIFGGIGIVIAATGGIPARLAGRVAEHVLLQYALCVGLCGACAFTACVLLQAPLYLTLAALLTIVPMVSVMGATTFALAMRSQGDNAGSAAALIGFCSMFSGGLIAPIIGIAGEANALPMALVMIFGTVGALACYQLLVAPKHASVR